MKISNVFSVIFLVIYLCSTGLLYYHVQDLNRSLNEKGCFILNNMEKSIFKGAYKRYKGVLVNGSYNLSKNNGSFLSEKEKELLKKDIFLNKSMQ